MEIVKLASLHSPFDTRIYEKEALSLIKYGYSVTIIVPENETINNKSVKFIEVRKPRSGLSRLLITRWEIFFKCLPIKNAVFHIHDSELLLMGIILKILGRKVIYDAHEDTPLQLKYQHWIPDYLKGIYIKYYHLLEKISGYLFDHIIIAEPVIGKYFPKSKTSLLRNFPHFKRFQNLSNEDYFERDPSICYIGLISEVRGINVMKEAFELCLKSTTELNFYLGGKFAPPSLKERVLNNSNITFLSWLSFDELLVYLSKSRIGLIIPQPNERYNTNFPVKLFEYMAAGIPMIASKYGQAPYFINQANCGIIVDPLNAEEVSNAILYLLNNENEAKKMGDRGRQLIASKYNWENEEKELIKIYEKIFR